ncbi:zinc-ribbon domain-containing protein [Ruminococcaceae bacterium OttesenSCG-928-A16]|nr:zinc-ribbon domain-containing protein [Ruminococcaceae bacterium OttesenSCG-928-A16]
MNFCPNCGAKNDNPSALFCSNCGYQFSKPAPAKEAPAPPVEKVAPMVENVAAPVEKAVSSVQPAAPVREAAQFTAVSSAKQEEPAEPEKMEEDIFIISKAAGARIASQREENENLPPVAPPPEETNLFAKQQPQAVTPPQKSGQDMAGAVIVDATPQPPVVAEQPAAAPKQPERQQLSPTPQQDSILPVQPAAAPPKQTTPPATRVASRVASIEQQINEQQDIPVVPVPVAPPAQQQPAAPQNQDLQELYRMQQQKQPQVLEQTTIAPAGQYPPAGNAAGQQRRQAPPQAQQQPRPQRTRPQPRVYAHEQNTYKEEPAPKKGFVKWIVLGALVLALAIGGFFGVRALTGDADKTVTAFTTALQAKDIETLKKITKLNNITNPADANWLALCTGLAEPDQMQRLQAQFTEQLAAPKKIGEEFPAVRLVTKKNLFVFTDYEVALTGVTVTVPKAVAGTLLRLDNMDYQGTPSGEGQAYGNVMPGRYMVQLVAADGSATAAMQMDIFTNVQWDAQPPAGSQAGEGDTPTPPQEPAASEPPASTPQSTTPATSTLTETEINTLLGDFYTSYLAAINQQKLDPLRRSTTAMKTIVTERMARPGNKENTFEYVSATCTASTIKATEANGVATITFNATFKYKYKPRQGEGAAQDGSNTQKVQLIYNNGEWLVNKMENA